MISILIPTYNYNAYPLAAELHKQCLECRIDFEILCFDDASSNPQSENFKINDLSNSRFEILKKNIGRSAIRNLLAQSAKFDNLLFLDADTFPMHDNFIQIYLSKIDSTEKVVYGGILYQKEKPKKEELLRWVYGNEREALSVEKRNQNPYLSFITLHFLISKSIFNKVCFNENIPNLRNEDVLFSYDLMKHKTTVEHIENPALHLGIENSKIFLKKAEDSCVSYNFLIENNLLPSEYTKILKIYAILKNSHLDYLFALSHKLLKPLYSKNLLSESPSLFIFDLYRLGYLCTLKK